jgi:hypothetical protein
MKKSVVASVLGIAAAVSMATSAHGQGSVWFDTYANTQDYVAITWTTDPSLAPPGQAGQTVGPGFTAMLFSSVDGFAAPLATSPVLSSGGEQGYIRGGIITVPGYASGPITFRIDVSGNGAIGSATFTEPSIATGLNPAGFFSQLPATFSVAIVPEPSTIALAGLGGLSLLLMLRRKKE